MKVILFIIILSMGILAGCSPSFNFGNEKAEPRNEPAIDSYTIPPNFIPQAVVITALGDSLSQGVGDEEELGGYTGRVAAEVKTWQGIKGVAVENTAKRGRRSDQLLAMFQQGKLTSPIADADYLTLTIGGNDVMRVVKRDLFSLNTEAFEDELVFYESRFDHILTAIRGINPNAPIIIMGIYNPFSLVTDEVEEFDQIIDSYNQAMQKRAESDPQACFVPVSDLFVGNQNLVYHSDFFHPNSKGYDLMTERILKRMNECGMTYEG
ncbi:MULTISPECIES: GDSL-type esterase/lipase family protein [Planococcus]|uniref:GDSL family lipase n=1 Tax=Planococcus faecalis TaxID=1598147 RepID=A0ABN4XNC2_9BACL|nr:MULTISPECIES: GDSL-type esterase/lipase family protein [Planococcus]AQU79442.1 GDSL family lipase [Planococcus faecalis]MDJ0332520.1 GDSL-type esterase/lipase family protein [Planococcus sp. S3-L1]OHX51411.1 GDSL family lipase [Planococcus faecalis]